MESRGTPIREQGGARLVLGKGQLKTLELNGRSGLELKE